LTIVLGPSPLGALIAIIVAFLGAEISDEERHVRRRAKIDEIERTGGSVT